MVFAFVGVVVVVVVCGLVWGAGTVGVTLLDKVQAHTELLRLFGWFARAFRGVAGVGVGVGVLTAGALFARSPLLQFLVYDVVGAEVGTDTSTYTGTDTSGLGRGAAKVLVEGRSLDGPEPFLHFLFSFFFFSLFLRF